MKRRAVPGQRNLHRAPVAEAGAARDEALGDQARNGIAEARRADPEGGGKGDLPRRAAPGRMAENLGLRRVQPALGTACQSAARQ